MVDLVGWLVRVVYCRMYSYCVFSLLLVLLFTNSKKKLAELWSDSAYVCTWGMYTSKYLEWSMHTWIL
jgi:hypothetical protein